MSKKTQEVCINKAPGKTRIVSLIALAFMAVGYWFTGYVNGNFSTDKYSDAFFQVIYLGAALLSLVAAGVVVYHSTRNVSWKERVIFIILAVFSLVAALENLFAGLMVGAFTNF